MTHDTRTTDEIERDIALDRSRMSSTIDDLQKKFSVDAIVDDLGHMARDLGDDLGHTISRTVGRNPAAMVVIGIGLAWLVLGASRNTSHGDPVLRSGHRSADQRGGASGRAVPAHDGAWFGGSQRRQTGNGSAHSSATLNGGAWMMDRAKTAAADTASSVADTASDLSDWLSHGLDDLSEAAKARVISARRAAHDAQDASEAVMRRGAGAAADLFRDQPLVVGALAVAFGAALGSMLPHSKLEDDTMGAHSDQLFRDAQAIYREERDKAMAMLGGAAGDVKEEMADIGTDLKEEAADALPEGKTVAAVVADRATEAGKRVYDSAKDRAASSQPGSRPS